MLLEINKLEDKRYIEAFDNALDVNESVKRMGACLNPALQWNDEFGHVRKIWKSPYLFRELEHFNAFILTNMFFECGIVAFRQKQGQDLKLI